MAEIQELGADCRLLAAGPLWLVAPPLSASLERGPPSRRGTSGQLPCTAPSVAPAMNPRAKMLNTMTSGSAAISTPAMTML